MEPPHSVSAHMLYENADPIELTEPGGCLNVSNAVYSAVDERCVRVVGSQWIPSDKYTVKLEGAGLCGYQTSALVLLRQQRYVENASLWCNQLSTFLVQQITERTNIPSTDYSIEFRLIGIDATLGPLETKKALPNEVGVLMLVTAQSQSTATDIARLCNPFLLHFPLTESESLPTFAFPYSPAESERGAVYEFLLNHVLELENPMDAFELVVEDVKA